MAGIVLTVATVLYAGMWAFLLPEGAFAWSTRRAGTPETGEMCVVVLITQ
jgi:hypothetical protein